MSIIAYDLGASSGRVLHGKLDNNKMIVEEIHRFPNDPVQVGNHLYWDILRLFHEVKQGLLKAKNQQITPNSVAIDSWAVDFGFIGTNGELLGNPYHYRDLQTNGVMEELFDVLPQAEIFDRTGIQFLPFNTIYQLYALQKANSPLLREADRLLMIPDLLRYFLTGEKVSEFSNVTTTQLYNPTLQQWDQQLIQSIGLSDSLFGEVVHPGKRVGKLRPSLCDELGIGEIPAIAVAEHDTGSAVAGVPALKRSFAYLSCGTWSLLGTEVEKPIISDLARALNFTNEGGVNHTFRLLKNIMGLWILQESKRTWDRVGITYTYSELTKLAEAVPAFTAIIDPDDPRFLHPGDMPSRIQHYCRESGQPIPQEAGQFVRCILESLALKYRYILELTEGLSGSKFNGLYMVGGGIHNTLLCQWTANALRKPVWAGPAEGSAIGNLAVQWIALGEFVDIWEARQTIRESFPIVEYNPVNRDVWEDAYGRFLEITGLTKKDLK